MSDTQSEKIYDEILANIQEGFVRKDVLRTIVNNTGIKLFPENKSVGLKEVLSKKDFCDGVCFGLSLLLSIDNLPAFLESRVAVPGIISILRDMVEMHFTEKRQ